MTLWPLCLGPTGSSPCRHRQGFRNVIKYKSSDRTRHGRDSSKQLITAYCMFECSLEGKAALAGAVLCKEGLLLCMLNALLQGLLLPLKLLLLLAQLLHLQDERKTHACTDGGQR